MIKKFKDWLFKNKQREDMLYFIRDSSSDRIVEIPEKETIMHLYFFRASSKEFLEKNIKDVGDFYYGDTPLKSIQKNKKYSFWVDKFRFVGRIKKKSSIFFIFKYSEFLEIEIISDQLYAYCYMTFDQGEYILDGVKLGTE